MLKGIYTGMRFCSYIIILSTLAHTINAQENEVNRSKLSILQDACCGCSLTLELPDEEHLRKKIIYGDKFSSRIDKYLEDSNAIRSIIYQTKVNKVFSMDTCNYPIRFEEVMDLTYRSSRYLSYCIQEQTRVTECFTLDMTGELLKLNDVVSSEKFVEFESKILSLLDTNQINLQTTECFGEYVPNLRKSRLVFDKIDTTSFAFMDDSIIFFVHFNNYDLCAIFSHSPYFIDITLRNPIYENREEFCGYFSEALYNCIYSERNTWKVQISIDVINPYLKEDYQIYPN